MLCGPLAGEVMYNFSSLHELISFFHHERLSDNSILVVSRIILRLIDVFLCARGHMDE